MIQKNKICNKCNLFTYIWKTEKRLKYCKSCWHKQLPKTITKSKVKKISPRSEKRIIADKRYSKLRKKYLEENPNCQIQFDGCTGVSVDIHHTYSGKDRATHYIDVPTWLGACRFCHNHVHSFPEEARKLGFLK